MRCLRGCVGSSLLALSLGCAGLQRASVSREHMSLVCGAEAAWAGAPDVPLALVALPPRRLEAAPAVAATVEGVAVGGGARVPWQPEPIAEALAVLAVAPGGDPSGVVNVFVDPEVRVWQIVVLFEQLQLAGLDRPRLVARSLQPLQLPALPDPGLAAQVRSQLDALDTQQQLDVLIQWIGDEGWRCPGAASALIDSARAPREQRCERSLVALSEALPRCPLADVDRFITLAQLLVQPRIVTFPTSLQLQLDPRGRALVMPPQALWSEALSELASGEPPAGLSSGGG